MLSRIKNKIKQKSLFGQILRFSIVGIANTLLGVSCIFAAIYFLGMGMVSANLAGYLAGFLLGYFLNRNWTFGNNKSQGRKEEAGKSMFLFLLVTLVAYGANLVTLVFMNGYLGMNIYVSQFLSVIVYSTISFLGSRFIVFGEKSSSESNGLLRET